MKHTNSFDDEIWRDVPGYEGRYQVSNYGRVKSNAHVCVYTRKDGVTVSRNHKEKILAGMGSKDPHTGIIFSRMVNGKQVTERRKLNHLVAKAFVDNPNNYSYVNHIDGNRNNCHADNLVWVSSYDSGIGSPKRPVKCITDGEEFCSVADCSRKRNLKRCTLISHIKSGTPLHDKVYAYQDQLDD